MVFLQFLRLELARNEKENPQTSSENANFSPAAPKERGWQEGERGFDIAGWFTFRFLHLKFDQNQREIP